VDVCQSSAEQSFNEGNCCIVTGRICVARQADAEKSVSDAFFTLARQLVTANLHAFMPPKKSSSRNTPLILGGWQFLVALRQFDHVRQNILTNSLTAAMVANQTNKIKFGNSVWSIAAKFCSDAKGEFVFRCERGTVKSAAVAFELLMPNWSDENYVLLPAAAYNGNRFLSRKIPYSPKLHFAQDIGPDKPVIITDVPRLNIGDGVSRIQERSGSMSVPCIGFRDPKRKRGFLIFTKQGNQLGDYGLGIEETRDRKRAIISITTPIVRELHNYRICDNEFPSLDQPRDFKAGDEVKIEFRIYEFPAPKLQDFFDKFAEVRKEIFPAATPKPALPFSACMELQEQKFNRDNFVPKHGYYSVGPRQNFLQDWQIGWTGGMISTYPLLFAGDARTRKNVIRNFDWLFPNGIAPSGFFWDAGRNGNEWIGGDIRKPHTGNWHLIRKSGDGVYFIIKQFLLMEKLGIAVKPVWRKGVKHVCDAFVKLWNGNKQFGQFVHSLAGEICVGGSTSGAIVPAALVLATDYFGEKKYLAVAEAAAEKFYREFIVKGLSCGGPGDALQNPDSESWYALIESYVALFEATGKKLWLKRAAETSRQFSTWVVAYDFQFPKKSTFGKAGIRTTGSVYANTQNKHSAPGLCTFSGLGLFKLFRATGDRFHLDMLRDIAFGLPQYLPHPRKPLGDAKPGWMCERVNMTDWEGPERIGETLKMTTWAETSLMLTAVEIPGLYVQPDKSLAVAFDNITAKIVADNASEISVLITNPTPVTATVKIFSESSRAAKTTLPENYLFGCSSVKLNPGESKTLSFAK
jgi:hypothetical protein